jgi:hypothetical protein
MPTLKLVARLPHLHTTWIGPGHTIPNGDRRPYAEGTKLCWVMAGPLVSLAPELGQCELGEKLDAVCVALSRHGAC